MASHLFGRKRRGCLARDRSVLDRVHCRTCAGARAHYIGPVMTPATRTRRPVLPLRAIATLRLAFAVLAFVGCGVSFARSAIPHLTYVRAGVGTTSASSRVSQSAGDELTLSLDQARLPKSGTRRVTLSRGPALPLDASGDGRADARGAGSESGRPLTPTNFIPGPPFHPPRAS